MGSSAKHFDSSPPPAVAPHIRPRYLRSIIDTQPIAIAPSGAVVSMRAVQVRRVHEGAALLKALVCLGVSRRCLASWIGCDESTVRDWCSGLRRIPSDRVNATSVGIVWRRFMAEDWK